MWSSILKYVSDCRFCSNCSNYKPKKLRILWVPLLFLSTIKILFWETDKPILSIFGSSSPKKYPKMIIFDLKSKWPKMADIPKNYKNIFKITKTCDMYWKKVYCILDFIFVKIFVTLIDENLQIPRNITNFSLKRNKKTKK